MSPYILILYYSQHGATKALAQLIAQGVEHAGLEARLRTVPKVYHAQEDPKVTQETTPFATSEDLMDCAGLALGSPARFGNMAAPLKYFIDSTLDVWLSGGLINKPAGVFTASSTMHGGQETTLMSMLLPLMHHGAYIVGMPYSDINLSTTEQGGTPYGPTHVSGVEGKNKISEQEAQLALGLGDRIAALAKQCWQVKD